MAESTPKPSEMFNLPPTRGDKRIVGLPVNTKTLPFEGRSGGGDANPTKSDIDKTFGAGSTFTQRLMSDKAVQTYGPATGTLDLTPSAFEQLRVTRQANTAAGLTDYIYIKLKGRAKDGGDLKWKFLVNPETIQVNRQVIDAESMSRAGLQTGIWGDLLDISIQGVTAGQYFAGVLVDAYAEHSRSVSSLLELIAVYENNGTWFEGEITGNVAAAAAYTRKQIQFQADVILAFGNFIWHGCFTELSVDDSADTPYYNKFSLGFMAWKERYRTDSPWRSSIANDQYFGHAHEVFRKVKKKDDKSPSDLDKQAAANPPAGAGGGTGGLGDTVNTNPGGVPAEEKPPEKGV